MFLLWLYSMCSWGTSDENNNKQPQIFFHHSFWQHFVSGEIIFILDTFRFLNSKVYFWQRKIRFLAEFFPNTTLWITNNENKYTYTHTQKTNQNAFEIWKKPNRKEFMLMCYCENSNIIVFTPPNTGKDLSFYQYINRYINIAQRWPDV